MVFEFLGGKNNKLLCKGEKLIEEIQVYDDKPTVQDILKNIELLGRCIQLPKENY